MSRPLAVITVVVALFAGVAEASWYDDYDAGLAAARKGSWSTVVQKMTAAINANPRENNKARAYGTIFYNYHPYYYRGVARLNLGQYEEAIADLEKTQAPGEVDLGAIGSLLDRAKSKLAASAPEPTPPVQEPKPTVPVTPSRPQIDPSLRQKATSALNGAKQRLQAAQQRRATGTQQYSQAMSIFTDATSRSANARSNDDLNSVISLAENAATLADLAMAPTSPTPSQTTPTPTQLKPKPTQAADVVLADYTDEVRRALELYFAGEFEDASRAFESLSKKMPTNGWIFAFLGASQYSQYAFEADEAYRDAALRSFRKAKQFRSWKGGLPQKYFSRRIRRAFENT